MGNQMRLFNHCHVTYNWRYEEVKIGIRSEVTNDQVQYELERMGCENQIDVKKKLTKSLLSGTENAM